MIKFEKTEVFNFEGAIRGMRNPLNSWDKLDSFFSYDYTSSDRHNERYKVEEIGDNDLDRMKKLIKGGPDHRKFMRQIFISVDITAPLYWWKEFDTYKVGTVSNSCSTMHTIQAKEFTLDDFSCEHLDTDGLILLEEIVTRLNIYRDEFNKYKVKSDWWNMIQLLPTSYNQKRTVTMSYENVYNIRHSQRATHKLDEWRIGFMDWIKSLPYAEELLE